MQCHAELCTQKHYVNLLLLHNICGTQCCHLWECVMRNIISSNLRSFNKYFQTCNRLRPRRHVFYPFGPLENKTMMASWPQYMSLSYAQTKLKKNQKLRSDLYLVLTFPNFKKKNSLLVQKPLTWLQPSKQQRVSSFYPALFGEIPSATRFFST